MHPIIQVPYVCLQFTWDKTLAGPSFRRAEQLRGALGRAFIDDNSFHQHDDQGRTLYRYPRIQYRWRNGHGIVAGWGEAANRLLQLPWLDLTLNLGGEEVRIVDALLSANHSLFAVTETLQYYYFVSPTLMLNQKNYPRYQSMSNLEQRQERDRLLVAQLLTAMRGLDMEFPVRLYAAFTVIKTQNCPYKNQKLLGLSGGFVCNAALPSGFAIGHGVSHGFGWIAPDEPIN